MEKEKINVHNAYPLGVILCGDRHAGNFVITFCSFQYTKALRNELEYTNSVQLEMTQLQMDRNVRFPADLLQ